MCSGSADVFTLSGISGLTSLRANEAFATVATEIPFSMNGLVSVMSLRAMCDCGISTTGFFTMILSGVISAEAVNDLIVSPDCSFASKRVRSMTYWSLLSRGMSMSAFMSARLTWLALNFADLGSESTSYETAHFRRIMSRIWRSNFVGSFSGSFFERASIMF